MFNRLRLGSPAILVITGVILYRQVLPIFNLIRQFPLNDFSVYIDGVRDSLANKNPYELRYFDRYNYSPAASVIISPLVFFPVDFAEILFTTLSIVSLWGTLGISLDLLGWKTSRPVKWLLFALILKTYPVKLTLALGQINLIIMYLIIKSYLCYKENKSYKAGIMLAMASILKLTPAPLILFFAIKKQFKLLAGWLVTCLLFTLAGLLLFGNNLTFFYWTKVVPGLMGEVTPDTLNLTYMNQSVTALLGRMGVFGNLNSITKGLFAACSLGIFLYRGYKSHRSNRKDAQDFIEYWVVTMIVMLLLPVFVWQHHLVFLVPAWLILVSVATASRQWLDWIIAGAAYLALNFYFPDSNILSRFHPVVAGHFLLVTLGFLVLCQRVTRLASQKEKMDFL